MLTRHARCYDRVMSWESLTAQQVLVEAEAQGADLAALRANLALTPAQRIAELVAMNRFHDEVRSRTLAPRLR